MPKNNRSVLDLFSKSFLVSAFIGVSYLAIIEFVQFVTGYQSPRVHLAVVLVLYILGVFVNYLMQRDLVFKSDQRPVLAFFIYNFSSALFVSALSSFLYSLDALRSVSGPYIEASSTALALLVISPISFLFFKYIFKSA
jgi:putative flippase GtrA